MLYSEPTRFCNGAVGCAFVNQIFLSPKLAVKGGSYLLLIIPGKLGDDLRRQLNNASVGLIGNTFSTVLTCSDPRTGNIFLRSVVCVNLGLQNVAAADLDPQVDIKEEKSKVICVSCYAKYNQEGWDLICGSSFKQTRSAVVDKIRSLTMLPSFDLWGLKIDSNKTTLTCFVRVPEDKAMQLFNSKDAVMFFRPFVSLDQPPTQETGVHIVWANKIHSTQELLTVTNTLAGVRGLVANAQSLGVRVETAGIASARKAIQHPTVQYTSSNLNVAGSLKFVARGFPGQLSANTIIQCFATPASDSQWKAWHVIPFRSVMQGGPRTWYLKADVPPSHDRLILPEGWKNHYSSEPTPNELFQQKAKEKTRQAEVSKEERRQKILLEQQTQASSDPWAPWNANRQNTGKGKKPIQGCGKHAKTSQ